MQPAKLSPYLKPHYLLNLAAAGASPITTIAPPSSKQGRQLSRSRLAKLLLCFQIYTCVTYSNSFHNYETLPSLTAEQKNEWRIHMNQSYYLSAVFAFSKFGRFLSKKRSDPPPKYLQYALITRGNI